MIMLYDTVVMIAVLMLATAALLPFTTADYVAGKDVGFTLFLVIIWFLYLAWCWQHGGMTIGMRAWKVRLIAEPGTELSWSRSLVRFVLSIISALPAFAGFFWSLIESENRTWHDLGSRTRLVRWRAKSSP